LGIVFAPTFPTFGEAVDAAAQVAEHKQAVGLASSRAVMSKRWWRQAAAAVVLVDLPKGGPVGARADASCHRVLCSWSGSAGDRSIRPRFSLAISQPDPD